MLRLKPVSKELYSQSPAPAPAPVWKEQPSTQPAAWDPNQPNSKENPLPPNKASGTQVFREPLPDVNIKAKGEGQWETRPVVQRDGDIIMKPVWIPKNPHLMAMSRPGVAMPMVLTLRPPETKIEERIGTGSFTVG